MPTLPHRRSIRLPGYDYAIAGAYFVTLLVHQRQPLFGSLDNGTVLLTAWGRLVETEWCRLPTRFPAIGIDAFIVMPDHMHGILWITDLMGYGHPATRHSEPGPMDALSNSLSVPRSPQPGSLGAIIGAYKATTARLINVLRRSPGAPVWQRNYFERIIRDDGELARITDYILANPIRADEDKDLFQGR